MFTRLSNGWELAKQSFHVLMLDKEMLLFPVFSGISCLAVLASFGVPLWGSDYGTLIFDEGQIPHDPMAYVILFAFYLVNYFVIVFFNSALVACAMIRFRGGDPTVSDGLRAATKRMPVIFLWAVASATVGTILRVIESRSERAGEIAAAILGAAWSIATYFVVPVLVIENKSPFEAFSRSWKIMRRTWGETIGASFGIGFIVFIGSLVCIIPMVLGGMLVSSGSAALGGILIVLGILGLIVVSLVSSTLDTIILAALYLYAAHDEVPAQFDGSLMRHAFEPR